LVGGSLFQLFTGVLNIDYWYSPMPFFFPVAHFWVAWMVMGALVVHVGAKLATASEAIAGPARRVPTNSAQVGGARHIGHGAGAPPALPAPAGRTHAGASPASRPGLSRRGFIGATLATSGLLVVTFVGEAVTPLRKLALLAPRNPVVGPQSLPVNQTALQAGVTASARDPAFALHVVGNCRHPRVFTLAELRRLPHRSAGLPITCVEGWIAPAQWRGVPMPLLLRLVGAPPSAAVRVESLEDQSRLYSSSVVDRFHTADPNTLLALELNGEVLDIDHGYPVRLIAPDRPGVLQTKWVSRVVVL
jgi:DMSO/TMAO reductase YedYZ molybdopterin-dependent catalytic subunit